MLDARSLRKVLPRADFDVEVRAFEVDLIAEDRHGNWIGIEVKLGGGHSIDAAAGSLLKLAEDRVAKPPQALLVVTGGQYSYRRQDGVYVVPLGCLGP